MKILITGGAGYIGSHFLESFLNSTMGHDAKVHVIDDLSSGHPEFMEALRVLAKEKGVAEFHFEKKSLLDEAWVSKRLLEINPDIVFHFAGKISVGESVQNPDLYFNYNVKTSRHLLTALSQTQCRKLVFSSTAAVYEPPLPAPDAAYEVELAAPPKPLTEDSLVGPSNPYGENKLQVEKMIEQASKSWGLRAVVFRYFNAAGASMSGRIGEWHEPETHLIPLLLESTEEHPIKVFGDDYPTPDGTCIRDYIHVIDLARAHLLAIEYLDSIVSPLGSRGGSGQAGMSSLAGSTGYFEIFNLGTNHGVSVKQMLEAASKLKGQQIPHTISPRRPGDVAVLVASSARAQEKLGWRPEFSDLHTILETAQKWHRTLQSIRSATNKPIN
jgi:UDP-glucose 4-epimerase